MGNIKKKKSQDTYLETPVVPKHILKEHRVHLRMFRESMKVVLMTSRFNDTTWSENVEYRKYNPKVGCVYCSPMPIAKHIPTDKPLVVLEMNNSCNQIMGLGLIRNHPVCDKYAVYENHNYNRYTFLGKSRIDRTDMTEEEVEILRFFDIMCFHGSYNTKRGIGITMYPVDILFRCAVKLDLVEFVCNMFKKRMKTT